MKPFVTSDGLRLDYMIEGEGKPVLCLPGLTRDLHDFDELAEVFRGEARVIRLTMRGRGRSDWAEGHQSYNIVQEAADIVEFMDFLGLEKALLVGTSRGGFNSMILAATAADRLAGVVLNDIGPELAEDGINKIMAYVGKPPAVNGIDSLVKALKADMIADFPDLDDAKWEELARRWFRVSEAGVALSYDPAIATAIHEQAKGEPPDMWGLFDLMANVPLALLRGENSDLLSRETVAAMQARRPDMLFAEVANRGHIPLLNEPESVRLIRNMLDRI